MLRRLGSFSVRRARFVLAAAGVFMVVAGVFGGGVIDRMTAGGFDDPDSAFSRARDLLAAEFPGGAPNYVLLVTAKAGDIGAANVATESAGLARRLAAEPGVEDVVSPWTAGASPALRSNDDTQGLIMARITGDEDAVQDRVDDITPRYVSDGSSIRVQAGGSAEMVREVQGQLERDLTQAELFSMPVLLVLLVLVFGSVVAAALPLAVGALAVMGALFALAVLTSMTDFSVFAVNLTTALGLGLAIDYSLFILSRYREELALGLPPAEAVVRSVQTAGRTILISAVTVAAALAVLLIFPLVFLRSFAYAGVAVVAVAAVSSIVVLPAMLALLGHRVNKWALWRSSNAGESAFWRRQATRVMRRPFRYGGGVLVLLVCLGAPFLSVHFGLPDPRVQPPEADSRQVWESIDANFARGEANPVTVVAARIGDPAARADGVTAYAAELSKLDGVARVDTFTGAYRSGVEVAPATPLSARFATADGTWLSVVPSVDPISPAGEALVRSVREVRAPFAVVVGGAPAELVDTKASLGTRLPAALGLMAAVMFVALFLFSGSVLIPVKALVLNLLSLSATFGAMVWVFQEGHLATLLDFTPTGTLDTNMPILMFCLAFGLSMDYEVFLLSRMKETYDATHDNRTAVISGIAHTGRIVSAAALLLAVVFIALATSHITFLKLLGVGAALAVIMDATLVRGVLVPALMRLTGEANWWAPQWAQQLHRRFGLREAALAAGRYHARHRRPRPAGPRLLGAARGGKARHRDVAGAAVAVPSAATRE
jgi:RND superfamily putative drug exporter